MNKTQEKIWLDARAYVTAINSLVDTGHVLSVNGQLYEKKLVIDDRMNCIRWTTVSKFGLVCDDSVIFDPEEPYKGVKEARDYVRGMFRVFAEVTL